MQGRYEGEGIAWRVDRTAVSNIYGCPNSRKITIQESPSVRDLLVLTPGKDRG